MDLEAPTSLESDLIGCLRIKELQVDIVVLRISDMDTVVEILLVQDTDIINLELWAEIWPAEGKKSVLHPCLTYM